VREDAIKYLHGEIAIFDFVEELHTLNIVKKFSNAVLLTERGQALLPEMTIRDMPDIMAECNRLDKILIQTETAPDCPGNLGNELDVDNTVGYVVIFYERENLSLVNVPGVCPCMNDPVRITGVWCTDILGFPVVPSQGISTC
jgi:hypothetical protein